MNLSETHKSDESPTLVQLQGETVVNAAREHVWAAICDPEVLARCIDGVEKLESDGENRFVGVISAKVGPVRAKFSGAVELTEMDPPNRYLLVGEGKGGPAGFAKGSAEVRLTEEEIGITRLYWSVNSQIGGKIAQLGARLIEGVARGYAENFFEALKAEVEQPEILNDATDSLRPVPPATAEEIRAAAVSAANEAVTSGARGLPGWAWVSGLVLLVVAVLFLLLA